MSKKYFLVHFKLGSGLKGATSTILIDINGQATKDGIIRSFFFLSQKKGKVMFLIVSLVKYCDNSDRKYVIFCLQTFTLLAFRNFYFLIFLESFDTIFLIFGF